MAIKKRDLLETEEQPAMGSQVVQKPANPLEDPNFQRPATGYYKYDTISPIYPKQQQPKTAQTNSYAAWDPKQNQFYQQAQEMLGQIQNQKPFEFNLDNNALYQMYKNQYTQLGQQAMQDTMGQAAALTGGYGSSYGQNVGQQAYNNYLTKLNDIVPELYQMELNNYNNSRADLYSMYNTLMGQYGQDYQTWAADRDYAQQQQAAAWNQAISLIQAGYKPSSSLLEQAGLSPSEIAQITGQPLGGASGSGGGGGGHVSARVGPTEESIAAYQASLGLGGGYSGGGGRKSSWTPDTEPPEIPHTNEAPTPKQDLVYQQYADIVAGDKDSKDDYRARLQAAYENGLLTSEQKEELLRQAGIYR